MIFPRTYSALERMMRAVALETETARDVVRKAGFKAGSQGGGNGVAVLTCSVANGERTSAEQSAMTVPSGYNWDDMVVGIQNWFTWPNLQSVFEWWPDGYQFGMSTTVTDLSSCTQIKNSWVVNPGWANPNVNIRVMASLDADNWAYPTTGSDWHFAGANVNCGQWFTYTASDVPYENYPARYEAREGVANAFPGGWTSSEWHDLLPEFRAENVYLRWTADFSTAYSDDPIYEGFDFLDVGYGEIRAR